nr:Gag-Pol polyprotein [Tanacetum cinerariifolium]
MSTSNTHQHSLADVGCEARPLMLEKGSYIPSANCFRRYLNRKRENRKWLNKAIDEGPYEFRIFTPSITEAPRMEKEEDLRGDNLKHYEAEIEAMNLILISIPNDIYNSVDACITVKATWQRFKRLMQGIELVPRLEGKNIIAVKWLWKNKSDAKNIVIRNESRLVVKGYKQEEGTDFEESFAPGVYVSQPDRFVNPDFLDHVYRLKKALYGLKQAPRACQSQYTVELLKKHGMNECVLMSTPMATKRLYADLQGTPTDQTTYPRMIGGHVYLTSSRPDIAFSTFVFAHYQARPTVKHLKETD